MIRIPLLIRTYFALSILILGVCTFPVRDLCDIALKEQLFPIHDSYQMTLGYMTRVQHS